MKKLLLLLFINLVIIIISVNGIDLTDNLVVYHNLSDQIDSSNSPLSCSNTGVDFVNGKIGLGGYLAGSDQLTCTDATKIDINTMTVNFWANISSIVDADYLYVKTDGSSGYAIQLRSNSVAECSTSYCICAIKGGIERECLDSVHIAQGSALTMYTVTLNDTTVKFYLNGSLIETDVFSNTAQIIDNNADLGIGGYSANHLRGLIDEVSLYNVIINDTVIEELYNNGDGCNPIENPTGCDFIPLPSLQLSTDMVNNTENVNYPNITLNYTGIVQYTSDFFNCSLYSNSVLNQTDLNINVTQNNSFFFEFGLIEQNFTFNINCTNNNASDTTGGYRYEVDTVDPIILSDFVNGSSIIVLDTSSFTGNVSDYNLFAYNLSILDSNKDELSNWFSENLTVNFIQVNGSRVMTSLGTFYWRLTGWDSHTAQDMPQKSIKNIKEGNIEGYDYNGVEIKSSGVISKSTYKYKDRYSFSFEYDTKGYKELFIESQSNLYILYDLNYGYYLVDFNSKQWIDFLSPDIKNTKLDKLNDNLYKLSFENINYKVNFNSIGDLNEYTKEWVFTVENAPSSNTTINLTGVENAINNVSTGLNMFWFWIIFIIAILLPFFAKGVIPLNNEKDEFFKLSALLSFLIFGLLFFLNQTVDYFNIPSSFKNIINTFLLLFMVLYTFLIDFD